jgi:hypothetical protein
MRVVPSIAALFLLAAIAMVPAVNAAIVDESVNVPDSPSGGPCGLIPVSGMKLPSGIYNGGFCKGPYSAPYLDADGTFSGFCTCL